MEMIYLTPLYNWLLLLNLLIVIGLFASLRLFSGKIAHINASEELLKKDNPAFGISLAGATFAITIMLSGIIFGRSDDGHTVSSAMFVALFGVLGIALMAVTRVVFDKVTLPAIHLRDEIAGGNKAVAIADAGNVLAAAVIIHAVMSWITVTSTAGIPALLAGYAVSQFILTAMTALRMRIFGAINKGSCLQDELRKGNMAVALWFAGRKIGTALAIATAARVVVYEEYDILPVMGAWFFVSIGVIAAWKILCFIAERIILFRVDTSKELLEQKNVAVGALQAVIYISLGFLLCQV